MELTPDERQRIFDEEKVRLEAQQELTKEKAAADAKAKAAQTSKGCAGCLTLVGLFLLLIFGTTSPGMAALTVVVGLIGLILAAFGDVHKKAGNPKAARIVLGVAAGLVLGLGVYGIVWTSSDQYKLQVDQAGRRTRQIKETEDQPPAVQKEIDDEYHQTGNTDRRR